jgi:glyoxylase-like metal-dependent hydrolase (beta-lactamase superfamily II)
MLNTPWLERLGVAGAAPQDIDLVICTHLHSDHCGWNTTLVDGEWVPTFPSARYVFSRADEQYWAAGQDDPQLAYNAGVYADSVFPIIEAGQAMIVDGTLEVTRGLTLEPAPGHTPGHLKVTLESDGEGIVFAGDSMHHALQVAYPALNTGGCFDPAAAESSRRSILATCADRGFLLAPAHFPAPHAFRVERAGDGFRLPEMHALSQGASAQKSAGVS